MSKPEKTNNTVTRALAAHSRARRRALQGRVELESAVTSPRRNDLAPELLLEYRPVAELKVPDR